MLKKMTLILVLLGFVQSANAIIELRAGYGIQTPAEENFNSGSLKTITGYNIDALVSLPLVPIGFGLRYEDLGADYELLGNTFEGEFQRTSLLINYRIIDLFAYFGVIGSFGLVNDASIGLGGLGTAQYKADLTYTVGAEAGVKLGLFMVGGELGYAVANLEEDGSNFNTGDLDMGGVYLKAMVGVYF
ncbi:MAG: hypothetical protein AAF203_01095 [Pseudomonadota bacterium]